MLSGVGIVTFVAKPWISKSQVVRPIASSHPLSPVRDIRTCIANIFPNDPIMFFESSLDVFRKTATSPVGNGDTFFPHFETEYSEWNTNTVEYQIGSSSFLERIMDEDEQYEKADLFSNIIEVWDDLSTFPRCDEAAIASEPLKDSAAFRKRLLSSCSSPSLSSETRPLQKNRCELSYTLPTHASLSAIESKDLDRQLEEELTCSTCSDFQVNLFTVDDTKKRPVPLLTPPGSPLTVVLGSGSTTTICEWPSNLIVDSALQAINELRPLSPASLELLERNEQNRVGSGVWCNNGI